MAAWFAHRWLALRAFWFLSGCGQVWLYHQQVGTAGMPVLHSYEWHLFFAAVLFKCAFAERKPTTSHSEPQQ